MSTTRSLAEQLERARVIDPKSIKASLPLAYVCARLGIRLDQDARGLCPFHQDQDPSFYLWHGDDGIERWSCHPCGLNGDVFDLIRRIRGSSFPEAVEWAAELLAKLPRDRAPRVPVTTLPRSWAELDRQYYGQELAAAMGSPQPDGLLGGIAGFACDGTTVHVNEALVWETHLRGWGWTLACGVVWIPHWAADGTLTGVKTRQPVIAGGLTEESMSVRKGAIPGSSFGSLYGAWRGRRFRDVLLTEGETDCVWADRQAQEQQLQLDCYSLPHGAGSRACQESIAFLRGARVFIAFDPDQAGRAATARWVQALRDAGIDCRVCSLPDGLDLRAAAPDLAQMIAAAR